MIYKSPFTDPYINLATEEALLDLPHLTEDIFMVWQSEPAFVIGRHQNPFFEIAKAYLDNKVPVIRRISGGGTIYLDRGVLNFTYITSHYTANINNYRHFLNPVIDALESLGLKAHFQPKSDLLLEGMKISGNAQSFRNNRLMHHGTILFDADLDIIQKALLDQITRRTGQHITSNRQPVTNVNAVAKERFTMNELIEHLIEQVSKSLHISKTVLELGDSTKNHIQELAKNKYKTWAWNFGKTPTFEIAVPIAGEAVVVTVKEGVIDTVNPQTDTAKRLIGERYRPGLFQ